MTDETKKSILHTVKMIIKQIDNCERFIGAKPYIETVSTDEHLTNLKAKLEYLKDTYPELLI